MKTGKKIQRSQVVALTSGRNLRQACWLVPVLIILLTVAAFFPALQNGFVNWDDEATLVDNPNYRGLGWAELRWMFSTFHMGHYQPLSWVTFGLDYLLWGMDPFGYHLTNLLLHSANVVLVFLLAFRLLSLPLSGPADLGGPVLWVGAGFSALVFAVHPLRVESVAWATERRDVLSGLLLFLTVLCYLKAAEVEGVRHSPWRWMTAAFIAYVLSLLSKAAGITLPFVLLVLDVYPLKRLGGGPGKWFGRMVRHVWWEKVPFLFLALAGGGVALLAQHESGALKSLAEHSLTSRVAQGFFGMAFYLWKTVWPFELSPLYGIPDQVTMWAWPFLLSTLVVFAISVVLFAMRRQWPAGIAIWACYVILVAPVLGIAQSGTQLVADRYSYLSCVGWALLAGAGVAWWWRLRVSTQISQGVFFLGIGLAAFMSAGLGILTWGQVKVWYNSEVLWRHAVAVSDKSSFAHTKLGNTLAKQGRIDEAMKSYQRAIEVQPAYAVAHYNLGDLLAAQGNLQGARQHLQEAVRIDPNYADAHNGLGSVLALQGEFKGAMEHFRQALKVNPSFGEVHFNLANVLVREGQIDEALVLLREAVRLRPDFAPAHHHLGRVMAAQGQLDRAVEHFREAVRLQPEYAEAHESLGQALAEQGKRDEAVKHYQEALRILRLRRAGPGPSN